LVILKDFFDLEEPVEGADHELGRGGCAVGAGGEVGDAALQAGKGSGLGFQFTVDAGGAPVEPDEPVPLNRHLHCDRLFRLGDPVVDPAQGEPGPVVAVRGSWWSARAHGGVARLHDYSWLSRHDNVGSAAMRNVWTSVTRTELVSPRVIGHRGRLDRGAH